MSSIANNKESGIEQCLIADRVRLRLIQQAIEKRQAHNESTDKLEQQYLEISEKSAQTVKNRLAQTLTIEYPEQLPIVQSRQKILKAIDQHQLVIIASETGSGKTTQLPKICLELGRGAYGMIGHTQPRRIAAHSVAKRIAEEMKTELGMLVGFQVRFHDQVGESSRLKLMTDGILLSEIEHDRLLLKYDTLIIDEAHERSLNIDFILGVLKNLLPKRPDLKVIITSATMDTKSLSAHFDSAPVIKIEGRSYPVEIHYRDNHLSDNESDESDLVYGVQKAVEEVMRQGPGDVLVFLPSEKDIHACANVLSRQNYNAIEVLPLFARLSMAEQSKVFRTGSKRRIILSTNVAETSLTVPGVRYVIDSGLVRMSRYSFRNKIQRLPIEKISRASANQRSGRCGRIAAGYCIRLYAEDDYETRDEFTEPEIKRTNLAAVILKMLSSNLGSVDDFPFIDRPDRRYINDGYRLLFELGAISESQKLTKMGRKMARYPIDPRIARMLIAASTEACLTETLIICSALSVQDPRERPSDKQQKADTAHVVYQHEKSDFLSFVLLWNTLQAEKKKLTNSRFKKFCQQGFISPRRFREWFDTYTQLKMLAKDAKLSLNEKPAEDDKVHRALLTGLLSFVGCKQEKGFYAGCHDKQFKIFPGSVLFKGSPKWLMAATIIETNQVYARTVAGILPDYLIRIADHVLSRHHSEPYWSSKQQCVMVKEKLSLYGLVIATDRAAMYSKINPKHARQIFIEEALLPGELDQFAKFLQLNRECIQALNSLENRIRKIGYLISEAAIVDFYSIHLPKQIFDLQTLKQWLKQASDSELGSLCFKKEDILVNEGYLPSQTDFPNTLEVCNNQLKLEYEFDSESDYDGISIEIPIQLLGQMSATEFNYLVPGLLGEKIEYLIRNLPKEIRIKIPSIKPLVVSCQDNIKNNSSDFHEQLAMLATEFCGLKVVAGHFRHQSLPNYLKIHFRLVGENGLVLATSSNLAELKRRYESESRRVIRQSFESSASENTSGNASRFNRSVIAWEFGELEKSLKISKNGVEHTVYPALEEEAEQVYLRLFESQQQANQVMPNGLVCLFKISRKKDMDYLAKNLSDFKSISLKYATIGQADELKNEIVHLIASASFLSTDQKIRNKNDFDQAVDRAIETLMQNANRICPILLAIMSEYQNIELKLASLTQTDQLAMKEEVEWQLGYLIYENFLTQIDFIVLSRYLIYLKAIVRRLEKQVADPQNDVNLMAQLSHWWEKYLTLEQQYAQTFLADEIEDFHWMIEEYRVSLFAQELKTAFAVSDKRLEKAYAAIDLKIKNELY